MWLGWARLLLPPRSLLASCLPATNQPTPPPPPQEYLSQRLAEINQLRAEDDEQEPILVSRLQCLQVRAAGLQCTEQPAACAPGAAAASLAPHSPSLPPHRPTHTTPHTMPHACRHRTCCRLSPRPCPATAPSPSCGRVGGSVDLNAARLPQTIASVSSTPGESLKRVGPARLTRPAWSCPPSPLRVAHLFTPS
jgi:hypothetical protein